MVRCPEAGLHATIVHNMFTLNNLNMFFHNLLFPQDFCPTLSSYVNHFRCWSRTEQKNKLITDFILHYCDIVSTVRKLQSLFKLFSISCIDLAGVKLCVFTSWLVGGTNVSHPQQCYGTSKPWTPRCECALWLQPRSCSHRQS